MGMNKKAWSYGILGILSYGIVDIYLFKSHIPLDMLKNIVFIQVGSICFFVLAMYNLKREVQGLLEKLSTLINHLIDKQQEEVFTPLKDEMPSKLQVQVTRLSEMLKAEKQEVIKEKEAIESLIGDIAHQLKTPLTNVGMYAELLGDNKLDEETYKSFYVGLRSEVDKLQFLMEALIKMSRLEGGVIKLHKQEACLQDTCLMAIKYTYMKAKMKGITIEYQENNAIKLVHDQKWTAEALENILDNAIKYSPENTQIKINIVSYEMFVRIDIQDEGMGIREEEIGNIFKRFYRGEEVGQAEGLGIGLYLARKIITSQGGYIKVKSEIDQGSLFSIFLPY